jgi:hypothetical protein
MNKTILHKSEAIYNFLLNFYPRKYKQKFGEEMKYVFSESLKDAYIENKEQGIASLWSRTIIDSIKSLLIEHVDNQKGGVNMKKQNDIIMQNKIFLWLAAATGLILLIPFFLMQFQISLPDPGSTSEVMNWTLSDFIVMGTLIFGAGFIFINLARMSPKRNRVAIAIACALGFFWLWAELAVGLFTNWGS